MTLDIALLSSMGCSWGQKETQLILSYILQSYIPSKSSWICRIPKLPFSIPEVHGHERAHKYLLVSRFPISIWAEVTACKQWAGLGWYSAPAPDTPLCPRTPHLLHRRGIWRHNAARARTVLAASTSRAAGEARAVNLSCPQRRLETSRGHIVYLSQSQLLFYSWGMASLLPLRWNMKLQKWTKAL